MIPTAPTPTLSASPVQSTGLAGGQTGNNFLTEIFRHAPERPREKTLVEGQVIAKTKNAVYVNVTPFGTGIIFGREYINAREIIKELRPGETITARVIAPEGEEGYIELSLKEAKQALFWAEAKRMMESKSPLPLVVKNANKGGLIVEWRGVDGFAPASQLKPEHYPRVPDGDKDKVMEELKKLVGQELILFLIGADPKENKLIFSEKAAGGKSRREIVAKYDLGDIVSGEITGVVDFGVFVKIEEGLEGLIHISELDWSLVENTRDRFRPGEKVEAKIIEIRDDKISLSLKALKRNPWLDAKDKYQRGDLVNGIVIKYNKHGALVSIEEGVAGLAHISEFADENDLRQKLELGKTYSFVIAIFEPKGQKLILSFGKKAPEEKPAPVSESGSPPSPSQNQ